MMGAKMTECWGTLLEHGWDGDAYNPDSGFFGTVLKCCGGLALVYGCSRYLARYHKLLALRPTIIQSVLHALLIGAVTTLVHFEMIDMQYWWIERAFPLMLAYFIMDTVVYGLPKKDYAVIIHHIVIIYCHALVGTPASSRCVGLGDLSLQRVGLAGFVSEVSAPFITSRWWMMKNGTTKTQPTAVTCPTLFAVNTLILIVSWIMTRIVMFGYILAVLVPPLYNKYRDAGALDVFGTVVFGNVAILGLSVYWLYLILKNGLRAACVFKPGMLSGHGNDRCEDSTTKKKN